jgi:pilus assembly protein FimV
MKTWLVALLAALLPCVAGAAGLGRLNVLSSLGQPLVAEIEVSATREELGSLSARLAHPDAYRLANLQYNTALTGARLTVERRPSGQHFIKLVSTRPVSEPFIDLLVELTWSAGRLSREYTALLDPPGITPAAPAPVISAVPESRPAPEPQPAAAPPEPVASRPVTPAPVAPMAGGKEYGPIERGETLGKIAQSVMPEGVTLEQMLVALYRSNPDAFIRKNLNLVRAGKILRVPDKEEVAAIGSGEAVKEYRTHVADWNSYRQKVAEAAGTVPAEGRTAVSGKITTKVEDKAAGGAPKDVVKLSKGEAPGAGKGKPRSPADRIRMLEEEAVAREKALNEANDRIAQLEKTLQDMKKLVELKSPGMAAAQQKAQQAAAPKPEPAAPAAKKPETMAATKPEPAKAEAAKPEPAKPQETPSPAAAKPEGKMAEKMAAPAPKKDVPASKPKAKPAAKAKEPELMDQILDAATDPLYLGVGGGILALGGLAFFMARRRRSRADADEPPGASRLGTAAATAAGAAAITADATAAPEPAAGAEDVDPLAEAEVYIAYGRDGQAEEILKDALSKNPKREDAQLKLLEIYSARKDKAAYGKLAGDLNKLTGGSGDNWIKAAAMGYALDPSNPLYAAGKGAVVATADTAVADVDLDLGLGEAGTSTDITLDAGTAAAGTDGAILDLGDEKTEAPPKPGGMPDFALEVPAAGSAEANVAPAPAAPAQDAGGMLDFQIELPKATEEPATTATPPAAAASSADAGLDFKLDGLNLSLDDEPKTAAAASGEKDGHWYDVQTKFDLAKAYQEMGDKDGAKEILQEVIKEGDAEQKAQAKTLLDSLG